MSTKCRHSSGLGSDLPADRRKNGDPCGSSGAGNALPPVGGPDARANNVGRASRPSDAENGLKMGQTPGGSCLQLLWTPHSQPNFLYHATGPCNQRYLRPALKERQRIASAFVECRDELRCSVSFAPKLRGVANRSERSPHLRSPK